MGGCELCDGLLVAGVPWHASREHARSHRIGPRLDCSDRLRNLVHRPVVRKLLLDLDTVDDLAQVFRRLVERAHQILKLVAHAIV